MKLHIKYLLQLLILLENQLQNKFNLYILQIMLRMIVEMVKDNRINNAMIVIQIPKMDDQMCV